MEALLREMDKKFKSSRLTNNHPEDRKPCDFDKVVKRAIKKLKPLIEESGSSVTFTTLPPVLADCPSMVVILENLIATAIQLCGNKPARVRVSAHRDGEECVFTVADSGMGIPPSEVERIFEPQRRSGSGFDLGLAVCRKMVESHGGRIWAESAPGEGSAFKFSLPQ